MGGFWEAKILDFRIFFVIFSMQILECKLEGQKIEKKVAKNVFGPNFGVALRYVRSWGEGLEDGGKANLASISSLAAR